MLRFDLGRSTLKPELSTGVSPDYKPDHPPNECVFRQHQPFHPSIKHSSKFFEKNLFCKKKKMEKTGNAAQMTSGADGKTTRRVVPKGLFVVPFAANFPY